MCLALYSSLACSAFSLADDVYTFTADNFIGPTFLETFSFTVPSLITTTGPFTTSFTIDGVTFTQGFFDATTDCFTLAQVSAPDCTLAPSGSSFFARIPGATVPGTYNAITSTEGCFQANTQSCELVETLTISVAPTTVPEPSSLMLLVRVYRGLLT